MSNYKNLIILGKISDNEIVGFEDDSNSKMIKLPYPLRDEDYLKLKMIGIDTVENYHDGKIPVRCEVIRDSKGKIYELNISIFECTVTVSIIDNKVFKIVSKRNDKLERVLLKYELWASTESCFNEESLGVLSTTFLGVRFRENNIKSVNTKDGHELALLPLSDRCFVSSDDLFSELFIPFEYDDYDGAIVDANIVVQYNEIHGAFCFVAS